MNKSILTSEKNVSKCEMIVLTTHLIYILDPYIFINFTYSSYLIVKMNLNDQNDIKNQSGLYTPCIIPVRQACFEAYNFSILSLLRVFVVLTLQRVQEQI